MQASCIRCKRLFEQYDFEGDYLCPDCHDEVLEKEGWMGIYRWVTGRVGVQSQIECVVDTKNRNLAPKCSFNRPFLPKYSIAV
jgi:DNA-directed RNA polymerase subunit RPC12/RpoP